MTSATLTIYVRDAGGTYRARCNGHTATCTAGEELAAKAVAAKAAKSMHALHIISRPYLMFTLTEVGPGIFQTEAGPETERPAQ